MSKKAPSKIQSIVALAICVTVVMPSLLFGQGAQAKVGSKESDQVIYAALDKKVEKFEFVETPLSDVIDFIEESFEINVELDTRELDVVGIGSDTPITRKVKGISLRSALRLMLRDLELTYMIQDECLMITTPECCEANLETVVFEVRDLVKPDSPTDSLVYSPNEASADFDSLIEVITSTCAPESWDEVGGPGAIEGYEYAGGKCVLIVSQTQEVHDRITDLLAALRKIDVKRPKAKTTEVSDKKADDVYVRVYPLGDFATDSVEDVADLVREAIGEDSWDDQKGTAVSGKANAIIVKHNRKIQNKVYELLVGIEAIPPKGSYLVQPGGHGMGGGMF